MEKDKKTLTISPNFKKKIDASSIESSEKSPIQLKKRKYLEISHLIKLPILQTI